VKFKVTTWYDTITTESAEVGDYDSNGNGMREQTLDTLEDAIRVAIDSLNCLENESDLEEFRSRPEGSVVLYSADAVVDYVTGDNDMYTACIEVTK